MEDDRLTISLPANLLAQVDAQVGSNFSHREDFVRSAVRHYLEYLQHAQNDTATIDIG